MTYNENLYYLQCYCTSPIFGKIFVPEIWAKIFLVNQTAGFFHQPYLQNKSMKYPDFLHVDTISHKLKVYQKFSGWTWLKMDVASLVIELWNWLYLKNEWMEWTDILHAGANSGKLKCYFSDFWVAMVRIGRDHLFYETLKSAVSKEWIYEFSWFFACWRMWSSNFWLGRHRTLYLWFLNASLLQLYLLDP